jgi:hypothetical protein
MNIVVHIERLILDGLPIGSGQGMLVQAALESELSRLLAEGGLASNLQSGGAFANVRASSISPAAGDHPTRLGQQIAQSVYGGIGSTK